MYVCVYIYVYKYILRLLYVYIYMVYVYGNQYVYHNQLEHNSIVLIFL